MTIRLTGGAKTTQDFVVQGTRIVGTFRPVQQGDAQVPDSFVYVKRGGFVAMPPGADALEQSIDTIVCRQFGMICIPGSFGRKTHTEVLEGDHGVLRMWEVRDESDEALESLPGWRPL